MFVDLVDLTDLKGSLSGFDKGVNSSKKHSKPPNVSHLVIQDNLKELMKLNFNQKKPKHEKKVSDQDVEMEDPTSDQEQYSDKAKKPVPPSKVSFWLFLGINGLKYSLTISSHPMLVI